MTNYDDYFPSDDSTTLLKAYKEFELSKTDEDNLIDIEKSIENKKLNRYNKKDSADYLDKLYRRIAEVKKNEYDYEGDANLNINEYLSRIKNLINQLDKL